ncbi:MULTISPECIES: hypothetical protein [Calothrix]|uniref:Uncharacterized protein n=2 Tax=Calothrix TaxID=1186 RepID=A0ABR8AD44_9CYAN|nr:MULTISPECIES: hypothetical protein [Calothrix]MBD2197931.1 hypothetical protein [Calothrix parietina FACHB-288]MBD2226784.1 hypothetical protein [Calothrix anomala FACHB-343]
MNQLQKQNLPWHIYRQENPSAKWVFHEGFGTRGDAEHYLNFMGKYVPQLQLKLVFAHAQVEV